MSAMANYDFHVPDFNAYRAGSQYEVRSAETQRSQMLPYFEVKNTAISNARIFVILGTASSSTSPLDGEAFRQTSTERQQVLRSLEEQWKAQVLNPNSEVDAKSLTKTVKVVFETLTQFGSAALDLRNLPQEKVNGVQLAVVLRSTLSRKESTKGWVEALEVAREALRREGKAEEDALSGLLS
jgi:hypothetical protein